MCFSDFYFCLKYGLLLNAEHRMNLRLTLMENRKALAINYAVQKGKCCFSLYSL